MIMTKAMDIMREAGAVVSVEASVGETVAEVLGNGGGHVVAVDDDQVAGVIDPALLSQLDLAAPRLSEEMVGNMVSLTFRTCRPEDEVLALRETFERSGAAAIVVVAKDGAVRGVIASSDLPGAVR